ncbi:hypothetical protein N665_0127s0019 [Sinapis alba]|nr:hypothetical protein N665_0127s0019 [Sinapis alba]
MEPPFLPKRLFALNEEPNGERVNTYHKIKRTSEIIDALDPEEIEFIRNSTFGKIIVNYDNPPFSGAFGYSVIVRRLKTKKMYEIWFLFASNPIRFSLREFAIVTGLNCGPLPNQRRRKKNPLNEKLYWHELFELLKTCTSEMVIEMLKKRVVKDKETRIKFACLAITFSFSLLIMNLIRKNEIVLSQDSVAFQGYVDAIRLVMLTAIPKLKEEVNTTGPPAVVDYDSEAENTIKEGEVPDEQATDVAKNNSSQKFIVIPGHTKAMDVDGKVHDVEVESMLKLIDEGFKFRNYMFTGGATAQYLSRMKTEKQKEKDAKEKHDRDIAADSGEAESSDHNSNVSLAALVAAQLKNHLGGLERRLSQAFVSQIQPSIRNMLADIMKALSVKPGGSRPVDAGHLQTRAGASTSQTPTAPENSTKPPSGGSHHTATDNVNQSEANNTIRDVLGDLDSMYNREGDKSHPPGAEAEHAKSVSHDGKVSSDTLSEVMDSLMRFLPTRQTARGYSVCFRDSTMPDIPMQQYSRFVKTTVKERPKLKFLDNQLCNPPITTADRLYFLFYFDQKHWVGSEFAIKKELNPIAFIFLYIIKAREPAGSTQSLKPFSVGRCTGIPHNSNPLDSAITTVVLVKGHSSSGVEGCKLVTPAVLSDATKLFVLKFYEYVCDNSGLPKSE